MILGYVLFIPYWVEYQARRLLGLFKRKPKTCAACSWLAKLENLPYEDVNRKCHE